MANSDNALTRLKRDDGRPFAFAAIDLAEPNGPRSDLPAVVVFQGMIASGELVSREITLNNRTGFSDSTSQGSSGTCCTFSGSKETTFQTILTCSTTSSSLARSFTRARIDESRHKREAFASVALDGLKNLFP